MGLVRAIGAGLLCRCPQCAKGPLFNGFLSIKTTCDVCNADLQAADTGDGPAVFVMLIGGFLVVPPVLILQMVLDWPPLTAFLAGIPIALVMCLGMLRPFKALLISLQFHNKAAEVDLSKELQ